MRKALDWIAVILALPIAAGIAATLGLSLALKPLWAMPICWLLLVSAAIVLLAGMDDFEEKRKNAKGNRDRNSDGDAGAGSDRLPER